MVFLFRELLTIEYLYFNTSLIEILVSTHPKQLLHHLSNDKAANTCRKIVIVSINRN